MTHTPQEKGRAPRMRAAPPHGTGVWSVLLLLMTVAAGACSTPADGPERPANEWVGETTTEGSVTTVVNTSGSVWGGPGTLVEEVSIGVLEGADEYMFGQVASVWAADDRIFVVDIQVPAVRVYDWEGKYLSDIGRAGEGPGEYTSPLGVAVAPDGEIWVSEATGKLHRYTAGGETIATYDLGGGWTVYQPNSFVMGNDGTPYKIGMDTTNRDEFGWPATGMIPFAADGTPGDIMLPPSTDFEMWCVEYNHPRSGQVDRSCNIPYAPYEISTFTPAAEWVLGVGTDYSFDVFRSDGTTLRVRRALDPVAIDPEERDYRRRWMVAYIRGWEPSWTWNGPEIPATKPAFTGISVDSNGRFWVSRELASRRVDGECTADFPDQEAVRQYEPCWVADTVFDAYGPDGRYLGEVATPGRSTPWGGRFVRDDIWVAVDLDEQGTARVKRYRLVLPGDSETD